MGVKGKGGVTKQHLGLSAAQQDEFKIQLLNKEINKNRCGDRVGIHFILHL